MAMRSARAGRAVFLDKDGTVLEDVPYNVDPRAVRLNEGAGEALSRLAAAGFALLIISNQSGVARGLFEERALSGVERRVSELLRDFGVTLTGFHYCPHHPEGEVAGYSRECDCRKPRPGMLLSAARRHHIDLTQSWMVGDILDDVEAGCRAGCRSVLLNDSQTTGGESEWRAGPCRLPDLTAGSLAEAATLILDACQKEDKCDAILSN